MRATEFLTEGLNPFHTDTTDMRDYDDMIKALQTDDQYLLKYWVRVKGFKPELVTMSPDQYIDTVVKYNKTTRHNVERERKPEKVDRYAKKMQAGEKFPILMLDYTRNPGRVTQEGIHRSMAAIKIGVKEVPVLIVTSTD